MDAAHELQRRARPVTVDELRRAREELATHLDVVDAHRSDNEFVDVDLARRVTDTLDALIDDADRLDATQRGLLCGAIDYFVQADDADNDLTSPIGIEDDAAVVNAACDLLGRPDLRVPVP